MSIKFAFINVGPDSTKLSTEFVQVVSLMFSFFSSAKGVFVLAALFAMVFGVGAISWTGLVSFGVDCWGSLLVQTVLLNGFYHFVLRFWRGRFAGGLAGVGAVVARVVSVACALVCGYRGLVAFYVAVVTVGATVLFCDRDVVLVRKLLIVGAHVVVSTVVGVGGGTTLPTVSAYLHGFGIGVLVRAVGTLFDGGGAVSITGVVDQSLDHVRHGGVEYSGGTCTCGGALCDVGMPDAMWQWYMENFDSAATCIMKNELDVFMHHVDNQSEGLAKLRRKYALYGDSLLRNWYIGSSFLTNDSLGDISHVLTTRYTNRNMTKIIRLLPSYYTYIRRDKSGRMPKEACGTLFEALVGYAYTHVCGERGDEVLRQADLLLQNVQHMKYIEEEEEVVGFGN